MHFSGSISAKPSELKFMASTGQMLTQVPQPMHFFLSTMQISPCDLVYHKLICNATITSYFLHNLTNSTTERQIKNTPNKILSMFVLIRFAKKLPATENTIPKRIIIQICLK